jgi:hypothetical protein
VAHAGYFQLARPTSAATLAKGSYGIVAASMNGTRKRELYVMMQRPRDMARDNLHELKLALDAEGFGERSTQSA